MSCKALSDPVLPHLIPCHCEGTRLLAVSSSPLNTCTHDSCQGLTFYEHYLLPEGKASCYREA